MPSAKWASKKGKHETPGCFHQGMVTPSPTGAGFRQQYPSIGCHGSPMEASCREVWDETTINSTSLAAIAQSLTAETLSSVSMHAQSSGLWTPCHRVLCDGLWLLGSRALRPSRLVLIFHTHPPKACSLITERALSCRREYLQRSFISFSIRVARVSYIGVLA